MNATVLEKSLPLAPAVNEFVEEQNLVKRAKTEDMEAYDELVRRYQERIYATLYHMTANHEDANDLAQEAFIKAYQAIKSFKGDSSFFTWVYRSRSIKRSTFSNSARTRLT